MGEIITSYGLDSQLTIHWFADINHRCLRVRTLANSNRREYDRLEQTDLMPYDYSLEERLFSPEQVHVASSTETLAMGFQHHQAGRLQEAEQIYKQILSVEPDHADTLHLLGVVAAQLDRQDVAIECIERAIRLKPTDSSFHSNLGNVFRGKKNLDKAIACYRRALQLKPDYADALSNLGTTLQEKGHFDEAIACCRSALALRPDFAEAHNNLGNSLKDQGRLDEAVVCFHKALDLKPDFAEALNNLGIALKDSNRLDEAIACFLKVLGLKPDFDLARLNLSYALLKAGNFNDGWRAHEARIKVNSLPVIQRLQSVPLWDGSPLNGRRILLSTEQGFGDSMQFIRYAPIIKAYGGYVIVTCQPRLLDLLKSCQGIDELVPQPTRPDETLPQFDVYLHLLSVPRVLGTTIDTIPKNVPYLDAEAHLVEQWRCELESISDLKVGIAWQGNRNYTHDRRRSIKLAEFEPLFDVQSVQFFNLQKGDGREQLQLQVNRLRIVDYTDRMDESTGAFLDTAAIMKNLDLVITSDTAVAHLAGALGVQVWVALNDTCDWRWLCDRDDCPWYPTMRIFRQEKPGDWAGVFRRIASELQRLASKRAG